MRLRYWLTTVMTMTGRALPLIPWLIYIGYTATVVLCFYYRVPNYKDIPELKGLTFPVTAMGGSLVPCDDRLPRDALRFPPRFLRGERPRGRLPTPTHTKGQAPPAVHARGRLPHPHPHPRASPTRPSAHHARARAPAIQPAFCLLPCRHRALPAHVFQNQQLLRPVSRRAQGWVHALRCPLQAAC
jgi:hypothetical protein